MTHTANQFTEMNNIYAANVIQVTATQCWGLVQTQHAQTHTIELERQREGSGYAVSA